MDIILTIWKSDEKNKSFNWYEDLIVIVCFKIVVKIQKQDILLKFATKLMLLNFYTLIDLGLF